MDGHRSTNEPGIELARGGGGVWLSFIVLVAFTGGASRYDALQILPLRTLSALFAVVACYFLASGRGTTERVPTYLFLALVMLMAIQLVPVPPQVWSELPTRQVVADLNSLVGLTGEWRPVTLSPMRTWNAFGSLIVPCAALTLTFAFTRTSRPLLQAVAGLGVINAMMGLTQIVGGRYSLLYFYEVTNAGGAVGLFANENHAAIFAACSMLVVAFLSTRARWAGEARWWQIAYVVAFFLIFLTALITGSRAGFVASIGSLMATLLMVSVARRPSRRRRGAAKMRRWLGRDPRAVILVLFAILSALVVIFVASGRAPAFADIFARDPLADLRWSLWPILAEMLSVHWLIGVGFGSFEQAYQVFEPRSLLMAKYINQAHNDWLQLIIEGGVVGGLLLVTVIAWIAKNVVNQTGSSLGWVPVIFWASLFTIIGGASLVDYPLRTPVFQLSTIFFLIALSRDARGENIT